MFLLLSFVPMTDDDILTVNSCSSYVLSCNFGHFKNVTWTETEICHLMSEYIHMLHYITCLLIHIVLTSNIKSSHSLYYMYCANNIASHSSSTRLTLGSIPLPSDRGEIQPPSSSLSCKLCSRATTAPICSRVTVCLQAYSITLTLRAFIYEAFIILLCPSYRSYVTIGCARFCV